MKATLLKHRWIISIAAAALLGACSRDARVTSGDSAPVGPSAAPPGGAQYVGVVPEGTDVQDVIDDNNLIAEGWLPDSGTLLFQAPGGFDPGDFELETSGLNLATESVKGESDAILFFEWDEVTDVFTYQDNLQCLELPTVHTTALGVHARVAVLDTGVDAGHPWVAGQVTLPNDPVLGTADLVGADPDGMAYAHGTHVVGIIATVAPSAQIYAFRVLDDEGEGTVFDLVAGIDAALAAGVDVINLSLSVSAYSPVVAKVLLRAHEAGVLLVAAAGNDTPGRAPVFPANLPYVIAVAATGGASCTDLATYSAWHATDVAFAAPGTDIYGAYPEEDKDDPRYYSKASGTSSACAVVTGSILLAIADDGILLDPIGKLQSTALPVNLGSVLYGRVSPVDAFGLN